MDNFNYYEWNKKQDKIIKDCYDNSQYKKQIEGISPKYKSKNIIVICFISFLISLVTIFFNII